MNTLWKRPWLTFMSRLMSMSTAAASALGTIACLTFATQAFAQTERETVDSAGRQAAQGGFGLISGNGRFFVFLSDSDDLVPGDTNGLRDVFVHDRLTGRTERVSVSSGGEQANGRSRSAVISANGRLVAFESQALKPVRKPCSTTARPASPSASTSTAAAAAATYPTEWRPTARIPD